MLPFFNGIPPESLWVAVGRGNLERRFLERDRFVADAGVVAHRGPLIYFVAAGQVAVALFDAGTMAERRGEQDRVESLSAEEKGELSLLRPPPLAREAKKNFATFMVGDLFNSAALFAQGGEVGQIAFYTVAPSVILSVEHRAIAELAVQFPFFEARLRRAIEASRDRLRNIAGVKQEILDFFIRQGVSVAGQMVRVRQLDSCIDCKLCEIACEERYGAKRLTLGGYQIGMLDFVFTCRTCSDQRCIDPCEYDSIKFDQQIQEVVINESSCVGCTLCAQSCPYDAIEMIDVEDPENPNFHNKFKKRLEKEGSLAFGSGTGRVARARRIANKCDHCMNYGEQACVSACPTGSLIEISAFDLFRERSPGSVALAQAGFERDVKLDHSEILPTDPFTRGIGVRDAGMAKVRRGRIGPVMMWGLALAAWLLALAEILLRQFKPQSSLQYVILRSEGLEPVMANIKVNYRAGADLAINLGVVGMSLLLISLVYPFLRRIKSFRRIASNTMWFDFHMMAGTMGPMFIGLHAWFKLDNVWAVPFWCMWFAVLSGVAGRYLYTQVPDLLNGRELEELDHQRAFGRYRRDFPQVVQVAERILHEHRARAVHIAERAGIVRAFVWIMLQDLRRMRRYFYRRRVLKKTGVPRPVWKDVAARTGRLMLFERRRVLVPRAQLVLHTWKKIHVIFSMLLAAGAVWHITATWSLAATSWPLSLLFGR
jgi:Fe-S-cluster-containing hydrogenase component 2